MPQLHDVSLRFELSSKVLRMRTHAQNPVWRFAQSWVRHCLTVSHRQYMVPHLTARPLFSPVYLNRTCTNSAILIIKMLDMIGIMQKLHLYHRLVEKYEYLFYFRIIIFFFYFSL